MRSVTRPMEPTFIINIDACDYSVVEEGEVGITYRVGTPRSRQPSRWNWARQVPAAARAPMAGQISKLFGAVIHFSPVQRPAHQDRFHPRPTPDYIFIRSRPLHLFH